MHTKFALPIVKLKTRFVRALRNCESGEVNKEAASATKRVPNKTIKQCLPN